MIQFYVIESGIPPPPPTPDYRRMGGGRPKKYCWDLFEISDSMAVETLNQAKEGLKWAKRNGRLFTYERRTQNGIEFYRIWRIQ